MADFITPDYIDYIISVENPEKVGLSGGKFYPHKSPEGGRKTIGYGHKLKRGEDFPNGLTEEQAQQLLMKDLREAAGGVAKSIGSEKWNQLDAKQKQMLTDYQFNLGGVTRKFPRFTEAVINQDTAAIHKEYLRKYRNPKTGKMEPLRERNRIFKEKYLGDQMASNEKKPNTSGKGSTVDILKNRGKQIDQAVKDAFGGIDTEDYFNNSSKSKKALQQELRATVAKGMKLIHSPGIRENIYKNLQTGNPVEKIADITVTVMNKIDKAVQKSGQKVPDEIKAAAANALMAQVFEIGEVSGLVQLDDEEKEATFSNAVSKYIQGGIQSGEIDKEALAEETGRSVQSMTPEQRAQIDTQMKRINEVAQASAAKYGGQLPVEQPTQGMLAGGGTEDVNA